MMNKPLIDEQLVRLIKKEPRLCIPAPDMVNVSVTQSTPSITSVAFTTT